MAELTKDTRENWDSRSGFILAAIGSAVGLGNLWAFPYKLYSHGGGAFLIPYFIGMLLIGIPVLILEFSLGHMTQKSSPMAFRGIAKRSEIVGWWGILICTIIMTFYAVVLAWCLKYLLISIGGIFDGGELPWAAQGADGIARAKDYFASKTLNVWPDDFSPAWRLGPIVPSMAYCLIAVWIMIFLCIFKGVSLVGKIVLWTVPLPWLMLGILVVRGLTLDGSVGGLEFYLQPEWSELAKPATWRVAFSQVFFSMSLAFGIMMTYASFLHRKSDINNNAFIIGLGDIATSFIGGIAIFATIGAMAHVTHIPVKDAVAGGPGLAFQVFPYALAQFPHSAWFSAVFFFALITLGIDSAFSILEAMLASIVDKFKINRLGTLIVLCVVCGSVGLIYCTRGGINWLGSMDAFVNGPFGLTLMGLLECLAIGWAYRVARLRHHANERSDWKIGPWWDWLIRLVIPMILAVLLVWSLLDSVSDSTAFKNGDGTYNLPNIVAWILAVLLPLIAIIISSVRSGGENIHADDSDHTVGSRGGGAIGLSMAMVSLAILVAAFICTWQAKWHYDESAGLSTDGLAFAKNAWKLLIGVGIMASVSLIAGIAGVVGSEANRLRPSRLARASAAMSIFAIGSALGLAIPLWLICMGPVDAANKTDVPASENLSGTSFAIMAVTLLVIFGGLLWCFYRAIRASSTEEPPQAAEDMTEAEMQ